MALSFVNYWRLRKYLALGCYLLIIFVAFPAKAEPTRIKIKVQATEQERNTNYFSLLLVKALEASKSENETLEIIYSPRDLSQARWISMLQKDTSNFVIWTMTDIQREEQLLPIRIPLSKGLFGYRVLIIRQNEQSRFDHIQRIEDFATLIGGQGTHWPDTHIMTANGLKLVTAENTESLFRMIEAKRFDYFPRGASEAWFELLERKDRGLIVEKNILLYYPADIYFFVNKSNPALANRIERGLEILIDSGEFDRFFYSHPRVSSAFNQLKNRRIIKLNNPYLPPATPVDHPRYWIDLNMMNRK